MLLLKELWSKPLMLGFYNATADITPLAFYSFENPDTSESLQPAGIKNLAKSSTSTLLMNILFL